MKASRSKSPSPLFGVVPTRTFDRFFDAAIWLT